MSLAAGNASRAHDDVLGSGDADHPLQPRSATRSGDLSQTLLRQGIEAGLRDDAEIAGQRQFETDAKAISAAGGDHRLPAPRRGGDVPREARDVLGRGVEKARDLAAA